MDYYNELREEEKNVLKEMTNQKFGFWKRV
jgi:hypothetical protein